MTILDDLADEVLNYPRDYLTIEIVDVTPASGQKINKDEIVSYRFQVTNRGPITIENATFLIEGLAGTEVWQSGAGGQWGDQWIHNEGWFDRIPAHQPNVPVVSGGSPLTFRPTQRHTNPTDLIRVSVAGWDGSLDHIMLSHSRADEEAKAEYAARVFPK